MTRRKVRAAVIGAGPGGYVAAIRLGQLGVETVLIEKDRLGGECLNYGCIPSKALISMGSLVHRIQHAEQMGITVKDIRVNPKKLQAWKQSVVDRLTKGVGILCKAVGVEVLYGTARFLGPHELEVTGEEETTTLEVENVIVATGSEPTPLKGFEPDGERVIYPRQALELEPLPDRMTIIGGGITGLEIGTMYAKLGSQVVVVELLDQLIPGLALDLVREVERSLKRLDVEYHVKTRALAMEVGEDGVTLEIETPKERLEVKSDVLMVSVGRRPRTTGLDLEKAGVEVDEDGFVRVDKRMQTNVRGIYAIGDVIGVPYLAHKASREGMVAAEVIAGEASEADWRAMPSAIFTDPEIATVGLSEAEAKEEGHELIVGKFPFRALGRALSQGEPDGFVKVIGDAGSHELLGVEIVGPHASDLISEAALALEMGAEVGDVELTIHPHPTLPEGLMGAAEDALGRAIHIPRR